METLDAIARIIFGIIIVFIFIGIGKGIVGIKKDKNKTSGNHSRGL